MSERERTVAALYALDGLQAAEVGRHLDISTETAKSYLKRAREKYRERGIDAGTRHLLRRALEAEGYVPLLDPGV